MSEAVRIPLQSCQPEDPAGLPQEHARDIADCRYRSLFEDSPIPLWVADFSAMKICLEHLRACGVTDFRTHLLEHPEIVRHCMSLLKPLDVNKSALQFYKAATKEQLLQGLMQVSGEWAFGGYRETLVAMAEGKTLHQIETVNRTLTGEELQVTLRWSVAFGHERTFSQVTVSVIDITARRQAEKALRENQRMLTTLMSNLPGMAYRCRNEPDWTIEFVSEGCRRLTGYHPADLAGSRTIAYAQIMHPEDRENVWCCIQAALRAQQPYQIVYRIHTSDQTLKWVWEQGRGVYGPDGELVALEGFIADITDRKKAEDALRQSEDRYRRLAENAQDVIYRYRLQPVRQFEYVSPALLDMVGYSPEELSRRPELLLGEVHPDDRQTLKKYLADKRSFRNPVVLRWRHKNGTWVSIELRSTPIYDAVGDLVAIEGIGRNISDRRQAEEAMLERASLRELSHRILSSQEEERRRLSRELHDEAGQALTAIKINTELLTKRIPDNLINLKQLAKDTTELTTGLISEVRRIAAALRPTVLEDLGLLPTLRWYTKSIQIRYGLRVRLISRGLAGRLEPSFETAVYRIVQEALTNVVRHAQARHVVVRVACGRHGLDLVVDDDGRGMDVVSIQRGTGLTGIRERAHLFGGTMSLESKVGVGTTLRVKFAVIPEVAS